MDKHDNGTGEKTRSEGNLKKSLELYLEAEKKEVTPELLTEIALIYDELKNYVAAKAYYHKAIDLDPAFVPAYYGLGTIYDTLEKTDEAIAFYKEALKLNGSYYPALFFLANLYDRSGLTELAIYHYEKTIEANPGYFNAYLNLSALLEAKDENKAALELLKKAQKIDAKNHLLYFNFGVVYRKLGQIDLGVQNYRKSLALSADYPYTFLNLAIIYKDDYGDLRSAAEIYTEGLKLHPGEAVLYYNRGCAYALLGQYAEAVTDLFKAAEIDESLYDYMLEDDELANLRATAEYKQTFFR